MPAYWVRRLGMVSAHPARAVQKCRRVRHRLHCYCRLWTAPALLEESTFLKVAGPARIERIRIRTDFDVTPDFRVGGQRQPHDHRLPILRPLTGKCDLGRVSAVRGRKRHQVEASFPYPDHQSLIRNVRAKTFPVPIEHVDLTIRADSHICDLVETRLGA